MTISKIGKVRVVTHRFGVFLRSWCSNSLWIRRVFFKRSLNVVLTGRTDYPYSIISWTSCR